MYVLVALQVLTAAATGTAGCVGMTLRQERTPSRTAPIIFQILIPQVSLQAQTRGASLDGRTRSSNSRVGVALRKGHQVLRRGRPVVPPPGHQPDLV